ncbi:MAG: helix-turn-helix domain-containing protein [Saccharofermentanales bacterium]
MEDRIMAIANRIKEMREILDISIEDMAAEIGVSPEEYSRYESGTDDFTFTFLFKAANRFGVDMTDLITGESPHLSVFSIVRKGEGLPIDRRKGFVYQNLAYQFKDRIAEPLLVVAKYDKEKAGEEIALSSHAGQEFDFILEGSLRVRVGGNEEILSEGDSIYYNSGIKHGMVAIDGDCTFMAVVMNENK